MPSFYQQILALVLLSSAAFHQSCAAFSVLNQHHEVPSTRRISKSLHNLMDSSNLESLHSTSSSRRDVLSSGAKTAVAFLSSFAVSASTPCTASAGDENDEEIQVYFGTGCFWHVQHEFVEAEKKILGRSDDELTSRAAYAGGKAGAVNGKVCYHNAANIADYGKLGHAEVVSMTIPSSKFPEFAVEYCKLFKDGLRPDQFGDRGPEYRNLVGLPGGAKSEYAKQLIKASQETGDQLDFAVGKGNDKDVPKTVFVMDTASFPPFVAEEYHQFHDGFNIGENYPNSYNSLAANFKKAGEDFGSCPNGMLGVGVGGL